MNKDGLQADIIAGLTSAVAGIPQVMAFAIIAGIDPIYGLYAAVIATIVAGFLMNTSLMTVAPTNALALALGSALLARGDDVALLPYLVAITVTIGIFQLLIGVLKLGNLTRFISNAVMTGFISGAGLLIVLGQLGNLTGIDASGSNPVFSFLDWTAQIANVDPYTTLIGIGSILMLLVMRRTSFRNLGLLAMLLVAAGVVWGFGWDNVALISDISDIPTTLPTAEIPQIGIMTEVLIPAVAIGILGLVQSAGVAQSLRGRANTDIDISRDFVGQGLSNIVAGIFGGMPSGGSISRTAINVEAGAKSRVANILAGIAIAVMILLMAPLIERIPLAALAGLLIVSAVNLIDLDDILTVWRTYIPARLAMVATFASTLIMPLEYSIYVGVTLSLLLYIRTASQSATLVQLIHTDDGGFREQTPPKTLSDDEPIILSIYGDPYFGAVQSLAEQFPRVGATDKPTVILRLRGLNVVGSTFLVMLRDYTRDLHKQGGELFLTGVSESLYEELKRAKFDNLIIEDQIFQSREKLLEATREALSAAKEEGTVHNEKERIIAEDEEDDDTA